MHCEKCACKCAQHLHWLGYDQTHTQPYTPKHSLDKPHSLHTHHTHNTVQSLHSTHTHTLSCTQFTNYDNTAYTTGTYTAHWPPTSITTDTECTTQLDTRGTPETQHMGPAWHCYSNQMEKQCNVLPCLSARWTLHNHKPCMAGRKSLSFLCTQSGLKSLNEEKNCFVMLRVCTNNYKNKDCWLPNNHKNSGCLAPK